jgi:hypothetical protein
MRQSLGIRRLPLRYALASGWLARLRAWLFGSGNRQKISALRDCSPHFLRDIGLLDDRRANRLLRDDVMFRR